MTEASTSSPSLVIDRTFTAPIELVWQLWTEPDHFKSWYGPTGATIPIAEFDLRVGGARRVCMEFATPDGAMQMWFSGEFTEIVERKRLAFTEAMTDQHGAVMSPADMGMPADHPMITEISVELTSNDTGTTMRLTHRGIAADSPGASGWAMAFAKLAALLESR